MGRTRVEVESTSLDTLDDVVTSYVTNCVYPTPIPTDLEEFGLTPTIPQPSLLPFDKFNEEVLTHTDGGYVCVDNVDGELFVLHVSGGIGYLCSDGLEHYPHLTFEVEEDEERDYSLYGRVDDKGILHIIDLIHAEELSKREYCNYHYRRLYLQSKIQVVSQVALLMRLDCKLVEGGVIDYSNYSSVLSDIIERNNGRGVLLIPLRAYPLAHPATKHYTITLRSGVRIAYKIGEVIHGNAKLLNPYNQELVELSDKDPMAKSHIPSMTLVCVLDRVSNNTILKPVRVEVGNREKSTYPSIPLHYSRMRSYYTTDIVSGAYSPWEVLTPIEPGSYYMPTGEISYLRDCNHSEGAVTAIITSPEFIEQVPSYIERVILITDKPDIPDWYEMGLDIVSHSYPFIGVFSNMRSRYERLSVSVFTTYEPRTLDDDVRRICNSLLSVDQENNALTYSDLPPVPLLVNPNYTYAFTTNQPALALINMLSFELLVDRRTEEERDGTIQQMFSPSELVFQLAIESVMKDIDQEESLPQVCVLYSIVHLLRTLVNGGDGHVSLMFPSISRSISSWVPGYESNSHVAIDCDGGRIRLYPSLLDNLQPMIDYSSNIAVVEQYLNKNFGITPLPDPVDTESLVSKFYELKGTYPGTVGMVMYTLMTDIEGTNTDMLLTCDEAAFS